MEELLEKLNPEDLSKFLINLNRFQLNRKPHIKKYNKIRRLHSEILTSMQNYILDDKYSFESNFDPIIKYIDKELPIDIDLDFRDEDDRTILLELSVYKNHPKLKSITEIYLEKNKFRNEEKVKLLKSMNNSYASLFKIVGVDRDNGYITYEDVFTKKRVKIIDVAMSSTLVIDKNLSMFTYNRIITHNGISFSTGIHCMMNSNHPYLQKFINYYKHKKISGFSICYLTYEMSKRNNKQKVNYNHKF